MSRKVVSLVVVVSLSIMYSSRSRGENSKSPSIIVGRVMSVDGTLAGPMRIAFDGHRIASVQPAVVGADWQDADQYKTGVAVPGLFDVYSEISCVGKNIESSYAVDASVNAIDAIDVFHRQVQQAVAHGVTSMLVAPSAVNVVTGAAGVFRATASRGVEVLRDDGPLIFALGDKVFQGEREPTSRMGAAVILRRIMSDARANRGHQRLQAFVRGSLDAMVVCQSPQDVTVAADVLRGDHRRITFIHTSDMHDLSYEMRDAKAVVVGPLTFDMSPRTLAAAGAWSKAGMTVALAGQSPRYSYDSLRISAALAVRYGMDSAKARQAITSVPATMAGVADKVGSITPGRFGDVVIFSDDPLRLEAKVLAVYVGGHRLYPSTSDLALLTKESR